MIDILLTVILGFLAGIVAVALVAALLVLAVLVFILIGG